MTPARTRSSGPPEAPAPPVGSARARAAARGIELVLISGRASTPRATFTPAVPPTRTTLGAAEGGGLAPPHVELAWDGATLWIRDASGGAHHAARIGAEPVGAAWRPLAGGEQLRVGQAVFEVAIPASTPVPGAPLRAHVGDSDDTAFTHAPPDNAAESARDDDDDADQTAVVDTMAGQVHAVATQVHGSVADGDDHDTTTRSHPARDSIAHDAPTRDIPLPAAPAVPPPRFGTRASGGAPGDDPSEQTVVVLGSDSETVRDVRSPAEVARDVALAQSAFSAAPMPARAAASPAPAPAAPLVAPAPSPESSMFQRFGELPPSFAPGPAPVPALASTPASPADRARAAVASVPVRTWILFGVTLAMAGVVFGTGVFQPPGASAPATAAAPRAGAVESTAPSPAPAAPARSFTPPVPGPAAGPGGTLLAASAPLATSGTPALPPAAVPERVAADTLAQGRVAQALAMYQALALAHPETPVYQHFATILRRKIEAQQAGACAPGAAVTAGGGACSVQ